MRETRVRVAPPVAKDDRKALLPADWSHFVSTREEMEATFPFAWRISSTMREGPQMTLEVGAMRRMVRRRMPPRMSFADGEEGRVRLPMVRSRPLRVPPL